MSGEDPFAQGPAWHAGTLVGFDLETTGVDTTTDRIVTAAVVHVGPDGRVQRSMSWLVDPGVPIPPAATAVHGVTTGQARASGQASSVAVAEIIGELEAAWRSGSPVVIFNAPYDLTLLDAEAARSRLPRLATRTWWTDAHVVDPLVMDRGLDRFRAGKRTLGATAEHYRAEARDAHSALGDAIAAVSVARAIAERHRLIEAADAHTMHSAQVGWHFDWAVHLQAHLRSKGRADVEIDRSWPLRRPVVGRHRAPEPAGRHRAPEPTAAATVVHDPFLGLTGMSGRSPAHVKMLV
ncbi:DNA polymerase-3 subunit epsilon [Nakamurella panacisegetis]|uniref:DNA polymerase-3 subunit epsilon n=1 Tax=Nakamurella panacisegetis TaxID=1090615 RepID=A0A1H0RME7_9ACTN|nr:exonuclease domain-containing protein [Nakamurella panacisegetis]SDP30625.1 DNA polymerase-3 subunit epsilon [Nakamurella panacisegetis]